jgi:hypothetical protein
MKAQTAAHVAEFANWAARTAVMAGVAGAANDMTTGLVNHQPQGPSGTDYTLMAAGLFGSLLTSSRDPQSPVYMNRSAHLTLVDAGIGAALGVTMGLVFNAFAHRSNQPQAVDKTPAPAHTMIVRPAPQPQPNIPASPTVPTPLPLPMIPWTGGQFPGVEPGQPGPTHLPPAPQTTPDGSDVFPGVDPGQPGPRRLPPTPTTTPDGNFVFPDVGPGQTGPTQLPPYPTTTPDGGVVPIPFVPVDGVNPGGPIITGGVSVPPTSAGDSTYGGGPATPQEENAMLDFEMNGGVSTTGPNGVATVVANGPEPVADRTFYELQPQNPQGAAATAYPDYYGAPTGAPVVAAGA